MKRKPAPKPVEAIHTEMVSDAVKMAANNYMLVDVSVSFWDGIGNFANAATKAARAAGAEEDGTRLYKDLMGGNKSHLDAVNRKHRRLRTYVNEEALQTAPKKKGRDRRGKKMIHINRIPEVLGQLKELSAIADAIERGDKRPRYGQENLFLNINKSVTVVPHEIGRTCTLITAYKTAT